MYKNLTQNQEKELDFIPSTNMCLYNIIKQSLLKLRRFVE